jgi:hypothetical protein
MAGRWVDVGEAASVLGISTDAVRKRIARGSLESDRPDGAVLVWLDDGGTEAGPRLNGESAALISAKDETIRLLREQLEQASERDRENRRIIAALTSRIPQLEAPEDAPGSDEPRPGRVGDSGVPTEAQEATERRSWWQRMLGG